MEKLFTLRKFKHCSLQIDETGQLYIFWQLNDHQKQFLGYPLHWFDCFRKADLCELHLKRPHLTCFGCKLRKCVSKDGNALIPITLKQIWIYPNKNHLEYSLFKNLLSLTNALS